MIDEMRGNTLEYLGELTEIRFDVLILDLKPRLLHGNFLISHETRVLIDQVSDHFRVDKLSVSVDEMARDLGHSPRPVASVSFANLSK
jgi:hypothetical protein